MLKSYSKGELSIQMTVVNRTDQVRTSDSKGGSSTGAVRVRALAGRSVPPDSRSGAQQVTVADRLHATLARAADSHLVGSIILTYTIPEATTPTSRP